MSSSPRKTSDVLLACLQVLITAALIPTGIIAGRARWEYCGKRDKFRTRVLQLAIFAYAIALVLMATMNFGAYVHPEVSNLGLDANGATALYAFEQITAAISNMSLAAVWLRTAVALTQILSKHRRPRLVRYTKSVGRWAYVVLAVLALVSLATEIWFERVLAALPSNRSTVPAPEQNPLTMARITSLTLDICYVVYTATLIPLILWQLMGRRMDKIALFCLLVANSFIDTEIILGIAQGIYVLNLNAGDGSLSAMGFITLFLQYAALLMLVAMGMRDPERLVDEDWNREWQKTWWMRPYNSQDHLVELAADEDHIVAHELPVKANNDIELDGNEIHEPGRKAYLQRTSRTRWKRIRHGLGRIL